MSRSIVISHSSRDKLFIVDLCEAMEAQGLFSWIDSHDLRGGSELTLKIHSEIEKARAFIVIISPDAFNSAWVAEETRYAAKVKESRQDNYPIIALLREGVELGALKWIFSREPVAIRVKDGPKGIYDAIPHILSAMGERPVADPRQQSQIPPEPVEELVLELKSPHMREKEGKRRASGRAKLTYIPSQFGEPRIKCQRIFLFISPLGPIEIEELRWYLERYYLWSTGVFRTRAENVEKKLPEWGQEFYRDVIPENSCGNIISAWQNIDPIAERRFSIFVDFDSSEDDDEAGEAANLLTGLPWELIHDGNDYLFQGARSVRSQRRSV
ncbi:MAG: hypothetical protein B6245_21010 [Desulfobacteraceae bacterium 4572_88]|nr:MAG: hypothetical protein B6245_21010 [Desulfobacteraceae bacterium 4572_88]